MRRFIAAMLCILITAALFSGCSGTIPKEALGISFDKVICEYSRGGGFGTILDTKSTTFTVYADNRIEVTSGSEDCWYSKETSITEAQKQEIIDALNEYHVWGIGDISDDSVLDAGSQHISLFNANGKEVYSCGGYAPNTYTGKGKRFYAARSAISRYIPTEIIVEVEHEADRLLSEQYGLF